MSRRARLGLSVLALLLAMSAGAHADSREERYQKLRNHPDEELFRGSERINSDASESRTFAYGTANRPSWLPRVLARFRSVRGANVKLGQHMLFHRNGVPTYLALVWHGGWSEDVFELHRVRVISDRNVQLKFVPIPDRKYFEGHFEILEPSGRDAFGDGTPRLFLSHAHSGNSFNASALRIIRLGTAAVDETPDWAGRILGAVDLDNDGRYEIIGSDDRWGNEFITCGPCGPLVPVILAYASTGYRAACRAFSWFYEKDRASTVRYAEYNGSMHETHVEYLLEHTSDLALSAAQSGDFATSTRILDDTRAAARKLMDGGSARDRRIGETLMRYFENDVASVIQRAAAEHGDAECPLADVRFTGRDYMELGRLYERRDD